MKFKPRSPKTKIYSIFNSVDFTNDCMLRLLTHQIALKANVRLNIYPN